jgi:hypothetical protein
MDLKQILTQFDEEFNAITNSVLFDTKWNNGTGYLNGAVHADLHLKSGDRAKTIDDFGRKVILIGTDFGNIVVFERHSNQSGIIVSNMPLELKRSGLMPRDGALGMDDLKTLIGWSGQGRFDSDNIGSKLSRLFAAKDKVLTDDDLVSNPPRPDGEKISAEH